MKQKTYENMDEIQTKILNGVDTAPTIKESLWGILLGVGYFTILVYVPLVFLFLIFGDPTTVAGQMIMSVCAQSITAIGILVAMAFISRRVIKELVKGFTWHALLKGFLWSLIVYAAAIGVGILDLAIFGEAADTNANQSSIESLMLAVPLLGIFFTSFVGPIIEEVIFRYYIFRTISKKSIVWAFIVTACAFGGVHLISSVTNLLIDGDWSLFFNDLRSLPDYIVGGAMFCVIYHKFKKLSYSIIAHMCYNMIATVFMFISFASLPITLQNVETFDGKIILDIDINEKLDTKILGVYINDGTDTITLYGTSTSDLMDFEIDNLEVGATYEITVEYQYTSNEGTVYEEIIRESKSTVAVASKY